MRYLPKTDGLRNNLYERIFITNSPNYEETLPTIANPPSLRQVEGKQVVWTVTEPESFAQDHERCEAHPLLWPGQNHAAQPRGHVARRG